MNGLTGLVAVIMIFGMPTAVLGMYSFLPCAQAAHRGKAGRDQPGSKCPHGTGTCGSCAVTTVGHFADRRRGGLHDYIFIDRAGRAGCLGSGRVWGHPLHAGAGVLFGFGADSAGCSSFVGKSVMNARCDSWKSRSRAELRGILRLRICFRVAKADARLRMTTGKDRIMSWHFSDHSPARNLYCASVRGTTLSLPWRTSGDSAKSL